MSSLSMKLTDRPPEAMLTTFLRYQQLLGCSKVDLSNTSSLYARYTTSVICNAMVQNSKNACGLSDEDSRPLCADTCVRLLPNILMNAADAKQAQQATNEEAITVNPNLCGKPNSRFVDQIRADFTVCALPADSLSGNCISGEQNEPDECGFGPNLGGLCAYCATSSPNATDSCCINSNATGRCEGVTLPTFTSMPTLFPNSTATNTPSASNTGAAAASGRSNGLSGGQIAGIVVGSVIGGLLLIAVLVGCCIFIRRRRRTEQRGSVFNQPSPQRQGTSMTHAPRPGPGPGQQQGYEVLPGGRVARMSALQGPGTGTSPNNGAGARGYHETSDSDPYGDSPESQGKLGPPVTAKRTASLSSNSVLAGDHDTSPNSGSGGQVSSPEGVASGQSEQLPFFKDYYSQDEIHPNDKVSVLWAYQPRAGDEFELERGDMLKVVGIWDDGWATGVRINERAEDYDGKNRAQRDSGVSNGSGRRGSSPQPSGEIKAFPLVCVCLPEHWHKTIEGDGSTESGSGGPPPI
jgi:hypothetical protein